MLIVWRACVLSHAAFSVPIGHAGNVFSGVVSCASNVCKFLFHLVRFAELNHGYTAGALSLIILTSTKEQY